MYNRGIVAAMESAAEEMAEVPLLEGTPEGTPEGADTAETDMLEAGTAEAEVTGGLEVIEAAQADSEGLGDIAAVLEESAANGGLDETSARVTEIAVESYFKRLGLKQASLPAMESFATPAGRIAATNMALENIQEGLKKVWAAIVAAVEKATAWIKQFIAKLLDANLRLADRAKKLKGTVSKLGSQAPKAAEISGAGFGSSLANAGGSVDKASVVKNLGAIVAVAKSMPNIAGQAGKILGDFDELALNVAFPEKFEAVKFAGVGSLENAQKVGKAEGFPEHPVAGVSYHRSPELPGNRAIIIVGASEDLSGSAAVAALKSSKVFVSRFNPKGGAAKVETVPTLDKAGMNAIVDEVIAATAAVAASKAAIAQLDGARDKFVAEIKKVAGEIKGGDDAKGQASRLAAVKAAATSLNSLTAQMATATNKVVVEVSKSALDYVEKSAAQYSLPKAEAAPAKEAKAA